jgi:GGDEF domain-containing protein
MEQANINNHGESAEQLLHHTDSDSYRAKKAGGNQLDE